MNNERCVGCFSKTDLHLHRVLPVKKYPEFENNRYNRVLLCTDCHEKIHVNGPRRKMHQLLRDKITRTALARALKIVK